MYSSTKIVTSVALMNLYDEGAFELTDPLLNLICSFGDLTVSKPGAHNFNDIEMSSFPIRINTLLSDSAGFSYGFIELNSIIDQIYNVSGIDALG